MSTGTWAATDLCAQADVLKFETELLQLVSNADNDYLATAVNIATATDPIVTGVAGVDVSNGKGAIEIIGVVNTAGSIADGSSLTVKMYDSADNVTYAEIHTGQRVYYRAASGSAITLAANAVLFRWVVPSDCEDYVKPVISSAAGNSGKIDIYTASRLNDYIDQAKEMVGVDLSLMLQNVGYDQYMDYSSGDVLLDTINNPTIFKLSAVFKTLELFYQNITAGDENSPYFKKQKMYRTMYENQIMKDWKLKDMDVNLDSTVDEYKAKTPPIGVFTR